MFRRILNMNWCIGDFFVRTVCLTLKQNIETFISYEKLTYSYWLILWLTLNQLILIVDNFIIESNIISFNRKSIYFYTLCIFILIIFKSIKYYIILIILYYRDIIFHFGCCCLKIFIVYCLLIFCLFHFYYWICVLF